MCERNRAKNRGPRRRRFAADPEAQNLYMVHTQPPADQRGLDVLYRQIRTQLMNEFCPQRFTAQAVIDGLAHDYVRLARARQMIEMAASADGVMAPEELQRWRTYEENLKVQTAIKRLLPSSLPPEGPLCSRPEALLLAGRIGLVVASLNVPAEEYGPEMDADPALSDDDPNDPSRIDAMHGKIETAPSLPGDDDLDDVDPVEKALLDKVLETIGEFQPLFSDAHEMTALLAGDRIIAPECWRALLPLLELIHLRFQWRINPSHDLTARAETIRLRNLRTLVSGPDVLLQAESYARDIEKAIEHKLSRLRS